MESRPGKGQFRRDRRDEWVGRWVDEWMGMMLGVQGLRPHSGNALPSGLEFAAMV